MCTQPGEPGSAGWEDTLLPSEWVGRAWRILSRGATCVDRTTWLLLRMEHGLQSQEQAGGPWDVRKGGSGDDVRALPERRQEGVAIYWNRESREEQVCRWESQRGRRPVNVEYVTLKGPPDAQEVGHKGSRRSAGWRQIHVSPPCRVRAHEWTLSPTRTVLTRNSAIPQGVCQNSVGASLAATVIGGGTGVYRVGGWRPQMSFLEPGTRNCLHPHASQIPQTLAELERL